MSIGACTWLHVHVHTAAYVGMHVDACAWADLELCRWRSGVERLTRVEVRGMVGTCTGARLSVIHRSSHYELVFQAVLTALIPGALTALIYPSNHA